MDAESRDRASFVCADYIRTRELTVYHWQASPEDLPIGSLCCVRRLVEYDRIYYHQCKKLLRAGADANQVYGHYNLTPLVCACFRPNDQNVKLCKLLLKHGALINALTEIGTALHVAAQFSDDHSQLLCYLLRNGADVNARDEPNHQTPLVRSAFAHNFAACKILLKHGADPNVQDYHGRTCLHHVCEDTRYHATSHARDDITELLLDFGANPTIIDYSGSRPRHIARVLRTRRKRHNRLKTLLLSGNQQPDSPLSEIDDLIIEYIVQLVHKTP